jgi:hypothetical protein
MGVVYSTKFILNWDTLDNRKFVMGQYLRFSLSGMMMVYFGWTAIMALAGHQWIHGIFMAIMTLCWAAAWRKRSITLAFMQFIGG